MQKSCNNFLHEKIDRDTLIEQSTLQIIHLLKQYTLNSKLQ